MKYLVSHQGQESGPFHVEEIVAKVRSKELDLFDYIYDEKAGDWCLLMEHSELAAQLKAGKPSAPPKPKATETLRTETVPAETVAQWFVLKGENRFGPFPYADMVKMLQQKIVFPFDFIWHEGLPNWVRVAEIPEFTESQIRQLHERIKGKDGLFVQRQHKRQKYTGSVIVHDNRSIWRGEGFEISKGGVGVKMRNSLIVPGQELTLHFSALEDWPAFNAVCEVVSKKYVSDATPVEYGLRFISMSPDVQTEFYKKVA